MGEERVLTLALGESEKTFNLENAVCNHGFFMMAPNCWNPCTKTLVRPLRIASSSSSSSSSVNVSIYQSRLFPKHLYIRVLQCPSSFSILDTHAVFDQVTRMLRLSHKDERQVVAFQNAHPLAKLKGFARLFRSPSLFEDAVKAILLCNVNWPRTLQMAEALCQLQYELLISNADQETTLVINNRKRKSRNPTTKSVHVRNFPTAKEVVRFHEKYDFMCRFEPLFGYRAKYVLQLAVDVESGKLELDEIERMINEDNYEQVLKELHKTKGFGNFVTANLLMCLGYYRTVPIDSETIRHVKEVHKRETCNKKTIQKDVQQLYDKYAPFQCLAYWMELLEYYESKFGKLSELPQSSYGSISGSSVRVQE